MNFSNFKNKKILITGHTGFKGFWLSISLLNLGAKIVGISLKPNIFQKKVLSKLKDKQIKNYFFNIQNYTKLKKIILQNQPDYIFHLAAQPIVSLSFLSPLDTWKTNLIGTGNLLETLKFIKKKCVVIIVTSDKCYKIQENKKIIFFKESDALGGNDPYSASKASSEIIFMSYYKSFLEKKKNLSIVSVRAGNIIGGGDWSKDRIIPDCVRSWIKSKSVYLRNPNSIRPWQHILDALNGYLLLAKIISKSKKLNGQSFNFGPDKNSIKTVKNLCETFKIYWSGKNKIKIKKNKQFYETKTLALSVEKAKKKLKWKPILTFNKSLNLTANWYQNYYKKFDIIDNYEMQIEYFKQLCKKNK